MDKYSTAVAGDSRFKHVLSDPRFKRVPKHERKLKVDSRFKRMFTDKSFKVKYVVDKRGRRVDQTSSEDLSKYYQLADDEKGKWVDSVRRQEGKDAVSEERVGGEEKEEKREGGEEEEEEEEEGDESEDSKEVEEDKGLEEKEKEETESEEEGNLQGEDTDPSSSDTDDDGPCSEVQDNIIEHNWMEADRDCALGDQTSRRLAVCNVDWDRISAKDLYVLVNSFVPSGGAVKSVKVYPSDFGRERMAYEDVHGPAMPKGSASHKNKNREQDEEAEDEESRELLRRYQLERLRYFYAVVECDGVATAEHIYEQCNGMEYEASSATLDLRFIPDDMTFDDRDPSSVASDTDTLSHVPSQFVTSALQQSTVRLTWDETDPRRLSTTMKKYSKEEALGADLREYLASSSSDSEFEEGDIPEAIGNGNGDTDVRMLTEEEKLERYKQLVAGTANKSDSESDVDMQITWEPGLKKIPDALERRRMGREKTTWESYLEERKEKKKKTKKSKLEQKQGEEEDEGVANEPELELVMMGEDEDSRKHFSLKAILDQEKPKKRKGKKRKEKEEAKEQDSFRIDLEDPRFSAMYESAMFAVDPSHPLYKPTKSMAAMVTERQKRIQQKGKRRRECVSQEEEETEKTAKQQQPASGRLQPSSHELHQLVKSIKSKTNTKKQSRLKKRGHMIVM